MKEQKGGNIQWTKMRLPSMLLLVSCLQAASSYKILVFSPRFSQSITNYLANIADTLVEAGHNVVSNCFLRDNCFSTNQTS